MATEPTRVKRNVNANKGRIVRVEQLLGRLEKRIEKLEKQNASLKMELAKPAAPAGQSKVAQLEKQNVSLKAELAKLRARIDQSAQGARERALQITRLESLRAPVQALVRGFKETPGAPFETWRMWMLATFRKQGLYRKQLFR